MRSVLKHEVKTLAATSNYAIVNPRGSGWRLDWKIELVRLVSRPANEKLSIGYGEDGHLYGEFHEYGKKH